MTTFKDAEKKKPASNTVVRALRVVRVIYELDSAALPVEFMRALTTVGIPYLNIAFLGLVLNQLQQRASLQQVMLLIGIFLAVRFLLQLCGGWFNKRAEDHETAVKRRLDRAVTEKLLTVSYRSRHAQGICWSSGWAILQWWLIDTYERRVAGLLFAYNRCWFWDCDTC